MSQRNFNLLQQARAAIKQGNKSEARQLLQVALQEDRTDYAAWLLLAGVTSDARTALAYVKQAAELKPASPTVRKARAWAERRLAEEEKPAAPTAVPPAPPHPAPAAAAAPPPTALPVAAALPVAEAAPAADYPPPPRRWLLWGGAGVAALVIVVLLGIWLWPHTGESPTAVAANTASLLTATPATVIVEAAVVAPEATATAVATSTPTPAPLIQAKAVHPNKEGEGPLPTWTITPSPTPTPTPTNTPMPTFVAEQNGSGGRPFGVGRNERWIDVNLTTQTLMAFEGDTPVLTTLISSGTWQYPTVTGQFRIYLEYRSQTMDGRRLGYDYYLENVPYVMYFYEDYALHGTFWHNNFGTPMSHGCVNLATNDAGWLFEWASIGTLVNVHY